MRRHRTLANASLRVSESKVTHSMSRSRLDIYASVEVAESIFDLTVPGRNNAALAVDSGLMFDASLLQRSTTTELKHRGCGHEC